jgi:hypothetical protein
MEVEQQVFKETESIKIIKNSRGYNWEIKILSLEVEKIAKLNDEMEKRYGSQTE